MEETKVNYDKMLTEAILKNKFLLTDKYKTHSEAIIIACYFNPQQNPYRLIAFRKFYETIKHLNHKIVECVIEGSYPELINGFDPDSITTVYTKNLLWHKEGLLNGIVSKLPTEYKYIFWVDADVTFTNDNWLVEGVESLQTNNLVQPFEYCIHLDQDQDEPTFDVEYERRNVDNPKLRHPKMWRSFGSNHSKGNSDNTNYDMHGHVGFAWGARREVLEAVPLYDRALVGGGDHIIAHASTGYINHPCIAKSFTDDIDAVNEWSKNFYKVVRGKVGYVKGDLYHIWHGDLAKRQYLKRVQEFTAESKTITEKDGNGLYVTNNDSYVKNYFKEREFKAVPIKSVPAKFREQKRKAPSVIQYNEKRNEFIQQHPNADDGFIDSLLWGYFTDSTLMGTAMGGNMLGAMIGDMMNIGDQERTQDTPIDYQQDEVVPSDTTDYTTSDNFS